ncbi:Peptidase A8 [Gammaproteobacteria bacterium]
MKWLLYDWGGWNVWLFYSINNIYSDGLDKFMILGTKLGDHTNFVSYLSVMILIAVIGVSRRGTEGSTQGETAAQLGLASIAVFVFSFWLQGEIIGWLKPALDFPRPPLALQGLQNSLHVVGTPEYHHSLPSGHATFAMLVGASFWTLLGRFRFLAIFFVLWVGVSRISLGMHFPADVMAGYLLSLTVVLMVRFVVMQVMTNGWPYLALFRTKESKD